MKEGQTQNLGDSVGAAYFTNSKVLFVKPTDPSQKTDTRYVQANDLTNNRGISFFGWYRVWIKTTPKPVSFGGRS